MKISVLTLAAALAAAPLAAAQTAPAAEPAPVVALPPATLTAEPAASGLTPLEAEACRRLVAEAQMARDAALAPPAPAPEPTAKPITRTEGVGAVTGSVVGQVAGAAVAGPVGAALGALVAGKVGQTVAGRAEKALSDDDKKKAKDAELAAAQPVGVPGPVPELLNECQSRGAASVAATATTITPVAAAPVQP